MSLKDFLALTSQDNYDMKLKEEMAIVLFKSNSIKFNSISPTLQIKRSTCSFANILASSAFQLVCTVLRLKPPVSKFRSSFQPSPLLALLLSACVVEQQPSNKPVSCLRFKSQLYFNVIELFYVQFEVTAYDKPD